MESLHVNKTEHQQEVNPPTQSNHSSLDVTREIESCLYCREKISSDATICSCCKNPILNEKEVRESVLEKRWKEFIFSYTIYFSIYFFMLCGMFQGYFLVILILSAIGIWWMVRTWKKRREETLTGNIRPVMQDHISIEKTKQLKQIKLYISLAVFFLLTISTTPSFNDFTTHYDNKGLLHEGNTLDYYNFLIFSGVRSDYFTKEAEIYHLGFLNNIVLIDLHQLDEVKDQILSQLNE